MPKLPAADQTYFGSTTPDGRFTIFAVGTATAPPQSWVYDWTTKKLTQWVVPERPRGRHDDLRRRDARALPGARRHEDPGLRPPAEELRPGPVPGRRPLPRRPRGAGDARLLAHRAALGRRGLRPRRAQRARQRRLRQDLARRRQRPEAPRRPDRHRGRGEVGAHRLRRERQGAEGGRHGRQLRRLRDAHRDDEVRGRLRRRRLERRHLEPRHASCRTRRPTAASSAPPSTATSRRTRTRSSSSPPRPTSTS